MNPKPSPVQRVIGLDVHPDTFTAAILQGPTPAAAFVEQMHNRVPMSRLSQWARKHTQPDDLILLEASGNSFQTVRTLADIPRRALVLESTQLGKLKEAHANNDPISAVRIAKAYLAGTAKEVWVPDLKTQERRDLFHAHRKAVKRTTQLRNRLRSYLSDNGVRLARGTRFSELKPLEAQLRQAREWSLLQWQLIEGLLLEFSHAEEQRQSWRSLIAQEVLTDPKLLALSRLCGVREMVAFGLAAFVGDIHRFARPKNLVKYLGLNPAFDDSGQGQWRGGIGGHGRKDLRALLIEAAHSILRAGRTPLTRWGKQLLARKSSLNLAVAAVARKLTVAAWYLMMGRWTPLEEIDARLSLKVGKMITQAGPRALQNLGTTRPAFRQQIVESLQSTRIYVLDRSKRWSPKPLPTNKCGLRPKEG
ncbi:MAG: IS110 family transposase [Verrucomicrobiales bacterium]|nr:IS110 family transposase [Verrucomicrobiales bacterium]MCP5524335.1 IS110 family transposase [Verrucomicrobiales bacterium]